ncbi:unnamed protein product [Cyprideis torosa]|uniref:Histidine ammonia-lyase n=1 Tax=Cyprideis torosa TaxID=163714 RepID=A0A7R8W3B1_9CRUS|nr:unnamed protein product [Cyprideis torosa]CAG0882819.1 unnamed protein product [Cyprideis torosa]
MKISVRIRGEWLQIPCKNTDSVRFLGQECLRRWEKLEPPTMVRNRKEVIREMRRTKGGAMLDPDDKVSHVLDDNDFVSIVFTRAVISPKNFITPTESLVLDGSLLTPDDLVQLGKSRYKIRLSQEAIKNVNASRILVEEILRENRVVYGITTGFGNFARTVVPPDQLMELQQNLIRSHAAGVGRPLSPRKTRMLLALRINVLAKGYSGISLETLNQLIDAFNANCLSWVPEQGSVGACGDLAPLAHLALGLMGEGKMWSPETGWGEAKYVLEAHSLCPIEPKPKEGLCLINGTQLITSLGAEAVERATTIAREADIVAGITLEVLKGSTRAFDPDVHLIRPHKGQIAVAKRLRALLHSEQYPSQIAESHRFCDRVQDAYTLRCTPQVHGVVHDTLDFVREIITTEMNSATDNPLVLTERGEIVSAGNFHGEYPGKAMDYLAIAVHELGSISERRMERLCNPALSELPAFLTPNGGVNSGFMIAHCTAASLVSENKALCHPSTVDSLPTSAGQEDHVSMGCWAARKALMVIENVERVVGIELLAACQALEFLRPLKSTAPIEEIHRAVRAKVSPWTKDRFMSPDIEAVVKLLQDDVIWLAVRNHLQDFNQDLKAQIFSPTAIALHSMPVKGCNTKMRKRLSSSSLRVIPQPKKLRTESTTSSDSHEDEPPTTVNGS